MRLLLAGAVAFSVALGAAVSAPAALALAPPHIFFAGFDHGTIGDANLDGTGVNLALITGANSPAGIAVSGQYIYWANFSGTTIGRANLDGTDVDQSFITGADEPYGIAIDGQHIYWANNGDNTIGRANLDGSDVDQSLVTGANGPLGMAVDSGHIYWTNGNSTTIGRANLDGTGVDESFITGIPSPEEMTVGDGHIYWTHYATGGLGTVGRANLDGTGVDQSFITGADGTEGIAVDAQHIYWSNYYSGSIGRANLDGTGVDQTFINGYWTVGQGPVGLALAESPVITSGASATFTVGKAGSVTVASNGPPTPSLTESGNLPSGVSFTDNGDGTATLSGTPAAGSGGVYPLTITADNGISPDATQQFSLTVQAPPVVAVTSPADGATYTRGQVVDATYSCQEGAGGPGLSSCTGTVSSGEPINTSATGTHSFTVTATSADGLSTSSTATYTVVLPSNRFSVSRLRTFTNGTIWLRVKVPGPGAIDVLETAWNDNFARAAVRLQPAPRRFAYARAHQQAAGAGALAIKVIPNARGRRLVHHRRYRVTLRLWVTYTPTGGESRSIGLVGLHLGRHVVKHHG